MNVAPDSNVFVKDPWLSSHSIRALRDYLAKTPYRMVLSEVVEAEVRARRRREFEEKAGNVADSLTKARKAGVIGLQTDSQTLRRMAVARMTEKAEAF